MQPHSTPTDQQIIDAVTGRDLGFTKLLHALRQENDWALSEKRLKSILGNTEIFGFSKFISSKTINTPLPEGLCVKFIPGRGKGLFATKAFPVGAVLFEEEAVLRSPTSSVAPDVRSGGLCAFCNATVRLGKDCKGCNRRWCSQRCRGKDVAHGRKHSLYWNAIEDFAVTQDWSALLGVANILISPHLKQIEGMPRVNLWKIMTVIPEEKEALERMMRTGMELVARVVPEINYDLFMELLGLWRLNNVQQCLFLLQSHLNHDCDPCARVTWSTSMRLAVKAEKEINVGDEITVAYIDPKVDKAIRQEALRKSYGFNCKCSSCI